MSTAGAERLKQSMGMEGMVVMFDSRICGLALGEALGAGVEQPPTLTGHSWVSPPTRKEESESEEVGQ
jgi:hypothetical protein